MHRTLTKRWVRPYGAVDPYGARGTRWAPPLWGATQLTLLVRSLACLLLQLRSPLLLRRRKNGHGALPREQVGPGHPLHDDADGLAPSGDLLLLFRAQVVRVERPGLWPQGGEAKHPGTVRR